MLLLNDIKPGSTVKVKCPATVANMVCGFDILGMCLEAPSDEMELKLINRKEIHIRSADADSR